MKKLSTVLALLVILSCMGSVPVFASNIPNDVTADIRPLFEVSPIHSVNQIGDRHFFDLEIQPNQTHALKMSIYNAGLAPMDIKIEAITATTAHNGKVLYSKPGFSDKSLQYSLASLISPNPKIVTVPALTRVEVSVQLYTPSKRWDGIILGALKLSVDSPEDADSSGVLSEYAYTIAVRLTNSELQEPLRPDFKLANAKLLPGNKSAAFIADVRNPVPALYKNIQIVSQLLRDGEPVINDKTVVDFAPNSIFPLTIIHEDRLVPGSYKALVKADIDGSELSLFEYTFNINSSDYNEDVDNLIAGISSQRQPLAEGAKDVESLSWFKWWHLTVILLLFAVLAFVLFRHFNAQQVMKSKPEPVLLSPFTVQPAQPPQYVVPTHLSSSAQTPPAGTVKRVVRKRIERIGGGS